MTMRFITYPTWYEDTLSTPDDAIYTLATIAIPRYTVVGIEAYVTGRCITPYIDEGLFAHIIAAYRDDETGVVVAVGAGSSVSPLLRDNTNWNVTLTISGSNVLIRVNGDTYREVDWRARWTTYPVSTV